MVYTATENRDERLITTPLSYLPGRPIQIRLRQREHRFDIDDTGAAVKLAGARPGWREVAERVVRARGWNVSRQGVVGVPAVRGRDIDALVRGTAEMSLAVFEAVLELEES